MKKAFACLLLFLAFSTSFSQTFTLNNSKFTIGSYYRSYDVLFDLGKATLRTECYVNLDSIVMLLNNNPAIKIEIGVHCDWRGSAITNTNITQARAMSILNYIASKGIDQSRMKAVGYGESKLLMTEEQYNKLCPGTDCEVQTKNRRVEYKIIAL